jgi:phage-related tail fiber protein
MALINVTQQNTFEEWRVKSNDLSAFAGDAATLATTATNLVGAINEVRAGAITGDLNTGGNAFRVQIDSPDTFELTLDAAGNLVVTGTATATRFFGPVTGNVTGNLTGNADSATVLATARSISITGDATYTTSFNGSANVTGAITLSTSGVTAGTYTKITVDAKGRATAGTALSSSDVTTALGYTPWHAGNDGAGSGLDADLLDGLTTATAATANTITQRDGAGSITANIFYGTATTARYADLAEKYTTDKEYAVGTVMVVSMAEDAECTQSFAGGQLAVGVISEKPAFLMNRDADGQAIALKGRVPVRVIGPIAKGQTVMASVDGKAIYGQLNPIGIALETNMSFSEKLVECVIL